MIKSVSNEVWAFDCEWVPDLLAGRLLYHLPEDLPSDEVLRVMWEQGGATPENPMPFLRTVVCRVVSIATVIRRTLKNGEVQLFLSTLPEAPDDAAQDEPYILRRFLADGVGARISAAKSAIVTSVSCPTADTMGIFESKIALATISLLNALKSSREPPPLAKIATSASFLKFNSLMASAISLSAPSPCTLTGTICTRIVSKRRLTIVRIS